MVSEASSLPSTLLALAGIFLGLSLLVQVLQELYKFMTSSKARAWDALMLDLLGPLWPRALAAGAFAGVRIRGPFELRRRRPGGAVLPLGREELASGLERTAPAWVQRVLARLRAEAALQNETPRTWSPAWQDLLVELAEADPASAGGATARELTRFLARLGHTPSATEHGMPAAATLALLRERFLPHVVAAEGVHEQTLRNFEFVYRRRNLRQSFLIGLLLAVALDLPFHAVYRYASRQTPAQAAAIAEQARALADRLAPPAAGSGEAPQAATLDLRAAAERLVAVTEVLAAQAGADLDYALNWRDLVALWHAGFWAIARFLFGCLATAVLVSFGAPFWNDAAGALLRIAKGPASTAAKPAES